jgi:hypothetical protein
VGLGPAPTVDAARPTSESVAVADSAELALEALGTWQDSHRPAHYVRYVRARERTAELLAVDLPISAQALVDEWATTGELQQIAVLSALTQLGVPYRTYARQPDVAFDCSGLTGWAWAEAGVEIPRSSRYQIGAADRIDEDETEAGHLVYYPGHISMYVGQGFIVQAPATGSNVQVVPMSAKTSRVGDPLTSDVLDSLTPEPTQPPTSFS